MNFYKQFLSSILEDVTKIEEEIKELNALLSAEANIKMLLKTTQKNISSGDRGLVKGVLDFKIRQNKKLKEIADKYSKIINLTIDASNKIKKHISVVLEKELAKNMNNYDIKLLMSEYYQRWLVFDSKVIFLYVNPGRLDENITDLQNSYLSLLAFINDELGNYLSE